MRIIRVMLFGVAVACAGSGPEDSQVQFSATVETRYGSTDGPLALGEIGGITLTQGNADTLLVTQFGVSSILVLTSGGDSVGSIGRAGAGPGEFSAPFQPTILHDTIWVLDLSRTIKRFTLEESFIDELRVMPEPLGSFQSAPGFVAALQDGNLLYRGNASASGIAQGHITSVPWVRMNRHGTVVDTVVQQRLRHSKIRLNWSSGGFMVGSHPADDSDRIVVDPTSRWVITAVPGMAEGNEISVRVTWQSLDGTDAIMHAVNTPAISSASALESWIAELAAAEGHPIGEVERSVQEQVPWPEHLPAVQDLMVDNDGRAWLATPLETNDSLRWVVVDRVRGRLGSLVLHASMRLHAAHGNTLWASQLGTLDEPLIVKLLIDL